MIFANITSYIGQDMDAQHYYCHYKEMEDRKITQHCPIGSSGNDELMRKITTEKESKYLTNKSGGGGFRYKIGMETNRFNTFEEIHNALKEKFPNQTIVTYDEGQIFQEMLYWKDGVNLGVKAFGEVWLSLPTSCYKDLLPPLDQIKIRCQDCGTEYNFDDVTDERNYDGRAWIKFLTRSRDLEIDTCCSPLYLEWNVIL
jgi:PHP family Zn ribbon phosphoesterase